MYELDDYRSQFLWKKTKWDSCDKETREDHPFSNPNFVRFDGGSSRLKILRPEKCNIKFLYDKYIYFSGKLATEQKKLRHVTEAIVNSCDVTVVRMRKEKTLVHVLSKAPEDRSDLYTHQMSYEHVPVFQEVGGGANDELHKSYTTLYHRVDRLRMVVVDLLQKVCSCVKYKIQEGGVAGASQVMYEDVDGKKLIFVVSGSRYDSGVYCESVSFVGEFSEYMSIDKIIDMRSKCQKT